MVDGRKKESRMDVRSSFERMEVSRDSVGSLKSQRNFTNLIEFHSTSY
jgi:hypothetical protein